MLACYVLTRPNVHSSFLSFLFKETTAVCESKEREGGKIPPTFSPHVSKRDMRPMLKLPAGCPSRRRYSSVAVVKMQCKNRRQTNRMLNSIQWHDKRLHMASWMLWCHRWAMSLIGSCSKAMSNRATPTPWISLSSCSSQIAFHFSHTFQPKNTITPQIIFTH